MTNSDYLGQLADAARAWGEREKDPIARRLAARLVTEPTSLPELVAYAASKGDMRDALGFGKLSQLRFNPSPVSLRDAPFVETTNRRSLLVQRLLSLGSWAAVCEMAMAHADDVLQVPVLREMYACDDALPAKQLFPVVRRALELRASGHETTSAEALRRSLEESDILHTAKAVMTAGVASSVLLERVERLSDYVARSFSAQIIATALDGWRLVDTTALSPPEVERWTEVGQLLHVLLAGGSPALIPSILTWTEAAGVSMLDQLELNVPEVCSVLGLRTLRGLADWSAEDNGSIPQGSDHEELLRRWLERESIDSDNGQRRAAVELEYWWVQLLRAASRQASRLAGDSGVLAELAKSGREAFNLADDVRSAWLAREAQQALGLDASSGDPTIVDLTLQEWFDLATFQLRLAQNHGAGPESIRTACLYYERALAMECDTEQRAIVLFNLATADFLGLERFPSHEWDIERTIALLEEASELAGLAAPLRNKVLANLGAAMKRQALNTMNRELYDAALTYLEASIEAAGEDRAIALNNLGNAKREHVVAFGAPSKELHQAVAYLEEAVALTDVHSPSWSNRMTNLASARFALAGAAQNDRSLLWAAWKCADEAREADVPNWVARRLFPLMGEILAFEAEHFARSEEAYRAVLLWADMLRKDVPEANADQDFGFLLAMARAKLHLVTVHGADRFLLLQALDELKQASHIATSNLERVRLGEILLEGSEVACEVFGATELVVREQLVDTIHSLESGDLDFQARRFLLEFAAVLKLLVARRYGGGATDIHQAVAHLEQALAMEHNNERRRSRLLDRLVGAQMNLARLDPGSEACLYSAMRSSHALLASAGDTNAQALARAGECELVGVGRGYGGCSVAKARYVLETALRLLRDARADRSRVEALLLDLYRSVGEWELAIGTARALVDGLVERTRVDPWGSSADALALTSETARSHVAWIAETDPRAALDILESVRGVRLGELRRRSLDRLERLRHNHEQLVLEYSGALSRLRATEIGAQSGVSSSLELEDAYREYRTAVDAIDTVDPSVFARPMLESTLSQLDESTVIVHLVDPTPSTVGRMFISRRDVETVCLVTEALDLSMLKSWLDLSANVSDRASDPDCAASSLAALCELLWEHLRPAVARMDGIRRLILVPCGPLVLLPWHAAGRDTDWLLNRFSVEYAITGVDSLSSPSDSLAAGTDLVCAFTDPINGPGEGLSPDGPWNRHRLWCGLIERDTLVSRNTMSNVLGDGDGDHLRFHEALDASDDATIVAHGRFDLNGRNAFIELDPPNAWAIYHAEQLSRRRRRLVYLSACTVGQASRVQPDEVVGFPNALLAAGFSSVVGANWPVSDDASAIHGIRFDEVRAAGRMVAVGDLLRETQLWLRDATGFQLALWLESGAREVTGSNDFALAVQRLVNILRAQGDKRPYFHPADWAAFSVTSQSTI